MRWRATIAALSLLGVGASVDAPAGAPASAAVVRAAAYSPVDPATWTNRKLAAQLLMPAVTMHGDLSLAERYARTGYGGVVLMGRPPANLGARLEAATAAAGAVRPIFATDEEGGKVQRLASLLGALPTAKQQRVRWTPQQTRARVAAHAAKMRAAGVTMDFAPVADLAIRGYYIDAHERAFATDPAIVSKYVLAWHRGLRDGGVAGVVKHWPGHGQVVDTHLGLGRTPHLDVLKQRDLRPFVRSFADGVPAVMVGHLLVPGLTASRTPATLSPKALALLRAQAGPDAVIVTDSLSMGAITGAPLHLPVSTAAIRSLRAGADLALFVGGGRPVDVLNAVEAAIADGRLPRAQAIEKARRVLALKQQLGLAPVA